ncbi:hypothetical protein [Parashewanella tropica]|uniref:hypothetical protein n=1 Tax=Parashewanella tropica TaxID=2547970 RepID=UPI00105A7EBF|nr:hypothetical protein [Parashewanella tropica]
MPAATMLSVKPLRTLCDGIEEHDVTDVLLVRLLSGRVRSYKIRKSHQLPFHDEKSLSTAHAPHLKSYQYEPMVLSAEMQDLLECNRGMHESVQYDGELVERVKNEAHYFKQFISTYKRHFGGDLSEEQEFRLRMQAIGGSKLICYIRYLQISNVGTEAQIRLIQDQLHGLLELANFELPEKIYGVLELSEKLGVRLTGDEWFVTEECEEGKEEFKCIVNTCREFQLFGLNIYQLHSKENAIEMSACLKPITKHAIEIACGRSFTGFALRQAGFKIHSASDVVTPEIAWPKARVYLKSACDTIKCYQKSDVLYILHYPVDELLIEIEQLQIPVLIFFSGDQNLLCQVPNLQFKNLNFEHMPKLHESVISALLGMNMTKHQFELKVSLIPSVFIGR